MTIETQLGLPFMGELMTCVLCGTQHRSTIGVISEWRCIIVNTRSFYICPNEFPPDGSPAAAFKEVYTRALRVIITTLNSQTDST